MKDIANLIHHLWKQGRLPLVEGLLLSDGTIYKNVLKNTLHQPEQWNAADKDYTNWYSEIDISQSEEYGPYKIFAGDGSYGSDGFILVLSKSGSFHWLLMDTINPIEAFTVQNKTIYARNNNSQEFIIPIDKPAEYQISSP